MVATTDQSVEVERAVAGSGATRDLTVDPAVTTTMDPTMDPAVATTMDPSMEVEQAVAAIPTPNLVDQAISAVTTHA